MVVLRTTPVESEPAMTLEKVHAVGALDGQSSSAPAAMMVVTSVGGKVC